MSDDIKQKLIAYRDDCLNDFIKLSKEKLIEIFDSNTVVEEKSDSYNNYSYCTTFNVDISNNSTYDASYNGMGQFRNSKTVLESAKYILFLSWYSTEEKKFMFVVNEKSMAHVFDKELSGGYGRSYDLRVKDAVCDLTKIKQICLVFDSSNGEYSSLVIGLETIRLIEDVFKEEK